MSEKIYCGSGIEKFNGDLVELNLCLSDIPKEHIFEFNGKMYTKLKSCKKREPDQYGKTHYLEVNTWKPEQQEAQTYSGAQVANTGANNQAMNDNPDTDLPFNPCM